MIIECIKEAITKKARVQVLGGESKVALHSNAIKLDMCIHHGIISYKPDELVLRVKAGTKLHTIAEALDECGQMLAFSPPDYGGSTIGGTYACALSGSTRPFLGALRDFVLGVVLVDGTGRRLRFGGQMMKNVAGYDVSRLLVGSRGGYGVIEEISFKVLPRTERNTYKIPIDIKTALSLMNKWAGKAIPLIACAYYEKNLYLLLNMPLRQIDKNLLKDFNAKKTNEHIWQKLNPLSATLTQKKIQMQIVPSTQKITSDTYALDWCGAKRYCVLENKAVQNKMIQHERKNETSIFKIHENNKHLLGLNRKLKTVFDPHDIFITANFQG